MASLVDWVKANPHAAAMELEGWKARHVAINKLRDEMAAHFREANTHDAGHSTSLGKLAEFIQKINALC